MKTILAVALMAVLAAGVIAPALDAYAMKADNSNKLTPKSFGEKTKNKIASHDKTMKSGFESIRKEQVKTFKKISEEYNAKLTLKNLYRLG